MALTNEQYQSITRDYEKIRFQNYLRSTEKRNEIDRMLPGIRALENRIASLSVQYTMHTLHEKPEDAAADQQEILQIKKQLRQMLTDAGYTEADLEPIYTCADCHDSGYISGENGKKEKCHCFRSRELDILYQQSNIRQQLQQENFDHLSLEFRSEEEALHFQKAADECMDFVKTFDQDYRNLFICGTVGTGKSFLSSCIAEKLLKTYHSVLYMSAQSLFDAIAANRFHHEQAKEEGYDLMDFYTCDLLIIDDLGTEFTNSLVETELFALINGRHLRKKSTIISTNKSLSEIRDRYTDRVASRIAACYRLIRLNGTDVRRFFEGRN